MELEYRNNQLVLNRATDVKSHEDKTQQWNLSICMTLKGQQTWLDSGEILLDHDGNA